jgi:peptidoglycan DL-endopeptidase CwlO
LKKKMISLSLAAVIGTSSALIPFSNEFAFASTSIEQKKLDIQNKQSNVNASITDKKKEIQSLQSGEQQMMDAMKAIDSKVAKTNAKIIDTANVLAETKKEITDLQDKIAQTQKRIEERNQLLKERARTIQQSSDTVSQYVDVILEAKSFSELMSGVMAVSTIVNADHSILEQQQADKKTLEESQKLLNDKLAKVQDGMNQLQDLKEQLKYQLSDKNSLLQKLKEQHKNANADLGNLQGQAADLANQEKAAEAEQEKERKAALALIQKEQQASKVKEQEQQAAKAKQQEQAQNQQDSSSGSQASAPVHHVQSNPASVSNSSPATESNSSQDSNPAPAPQVSQGGSSTIEAAISIGSSIVGRSPYNWGGGRNSTDIQNRSFDCSSFVHWAYATAGVDLGPITSASTDTLVQYGTAVSASDMKRGDLVFFDTYKTNGHVGIYLGNGTFLDDNSSRGVSVDSMDNPYWKSVFSGVVRRIVQ